MAWLQCNNGGLAPHARDKSALAEGDTFWQGQVEATRGGDLDGSLEEDVEDRADGTLPDEIQ